MNKDFIIKQLKTEDDLILEKFLNSVGKCNPSVLGYHYPLYRDMLKRVKIGKPFYLGAFINDKLVGYIPGFIKKSSFGSAYCSLPYFGPNAGLIIDSSHRDMASSILEKAINIIAKRNKDLLTISFYTPFLDSKFAHYEKALGKYIEVKKFTQYLDLGQAKWDKKIQYDIRKCVNSGVAVEKTINTRNINDLYRIYLENCRDYKIPIKPKIAVEYLIKRGVKENKIGYYFAFSKNKKMVGGLIVIWSPKTASYYIPCSLKSVRSLQINTFLIDTAVSEAKKRGIKYWNWESSPSVDSGVFQFKKKWGSKVSKYKIFIKLFCREEKIKEIGFKNISKFFPRFYIYPFNK